MTDPVERLVNLALFLASAAHPVSAEDIRANVDGYSAGQDSDAFLRMFERDKDLLRDAGFAIDEADGRYRLDAASTFASDVDLTAEEVAVIRVVGMALLDDPSFPFADDLRLALAKLATSFEAQEAPVVMRLAAEQPALQGAAVAALDDAVTARKRVTFCYTNQRGEQKTHEVEPYGLFARDGWWYLVARDIALDEMRVYAVARTGDLSVNAKRPKSPDFVRPADFDVAGFIRLPFQYGSEEFEATVRIAPEQAWRAQALTSGAGTLEPSGRAVVWRVAVRDSSRLLRWLVENGPGLELIEPESLVRRSRERMVETAALHG